MKKSINLNSQEWCDVVFKDKNKSYGAYELRMNSSKRHIFAFGTVVLLAVALVMASMMMTKASAATRLHTEADDMEHELSIVDYEEVIIEMNAPEPPKIEKEKVLNTVAYTPPVIGEDVDVPEDIEIAIVDDVIADGRAIGHIDISDGTDDREAEILTEIMEIVEEPVTPKIYDFTEVPAQFPGGTDEMMRYIKKSLVYPVMDQQEGRQGRVVVRFVVSKTGEIEQVKVQKGVSPSCDREAMRVVRSMPKWIPGRQNGHPVAVYFTLPIVYRLQ